MKSVFYILVLFFSLWAFPGWAEPTFGDLAVLLAKGYFQNYVAEDASLEECVGFLNKQGVCFSLFDLMDRSRRVTKEDFARVVGQSKLIFLGEAEFKSGCVKRPSEAASWVDYCLLNEIDLEKLWNSFNKRVSKESLPEVIRFLETALIGRTSSEEKYDENTFCTHDDFAVFCGFFTGFARAG